jgi:HK97 family phage portal protein
MPSDVKRDTNPLGTPFYRVRDARGIETSIPASDMFVLRGFGLDGEGVNILEVAKATIGLTVAQTEYAARFFSQDQTPPIIVKFPQKMGPSGIENFKAAWRKWHQGPDRWHEPGVIQEGGEVQQLLPTAEQAQLIEQRRFQIGEVCRLFRMPPHKLADLERATFSNIENMNRHYYTETLRPWLVRWEQAIRRQLIAPDEQPIYYAEHTIEGLLRGDFKTQTDGFSRLLEKGVYSINEVRALLNLNPIEDGDKHYIQLNMQAVADAATGAVVAEGTKNVPVGKPYVNGSPMDAAIGRQN